MRVGNFAKLCNDKISGSSLLPSNYLSTENMIPEFGGFALSNNVPHIMVTKYLKADILLSNIRPYFKKMVYAKQDGGCSNDVLCIRTDSSICLAKYLYYALSTETFFAKYVASCKGTKMPRGDKNVLLDYEINLPSIGDQQHIVDTIGSVDSLIEFNQEKISKIKSLATQKYEFLYKAYPKSAIGKKLKFIKGKQPKFASKEDGLPYLVIDDLASNIYTHFSSEGLACDENDVLMVMDGASSGKVFTGNKGYVGSTLAKLSSSQIKSSILYFGLSKFEEEIMKNTTGSAIPHTDKSFVCELQIIDDLDGKTIDFFDFCLNQICNLRTQNSLLNIQKEILLQKFFH